MVGVADIRLSRQPTLQFRSRSCRSQSQPIGEQSHGHTMPGIADQLIEHRERRPRPKDHSFKRFGTPGSDPAGKLR